eukprot:366157-Chlamydomonas_euryale.AAC.6
MQDLHGMLYALAFPPLRPCILTTRFPAVAPPHTDSKLGFPPLRPCTLIENCAPCGLDCGDGRFNGIGDRRLFRGHETRGIGTSISLAPYLAIVHPHCPRAVARAFPYPLLGPILTFSGPSSHILSEPRVSELCEILNLPSRLCMIAPVCRHAAPLCSSLRGVVMRSHYVQACTWANPSDKARPDATGNTAAVLNIGKQYSGFTQ